MTGIDGGDPRSTTGTNCWKAGLRGKNSIAIWAKTDDMTKNISLKTLVVAMLALDVAVHRGAWLWLAGHSGFDLRQAGSLVVHILSCSVQSWSRDRPITWWWRKYYEVKLVKKRWRMIWRNQECNAKEMWKCRRSAMTWMGMLFNIEE